MSLPLRGGAVHVVAVLLYALVAITLSWPLAARLGTHLTGPPAGDTGVYVWNQWVFQREILEARKMPYFTDRLFGQRRSANLALHNYTTFQNMLALPLIRVFGVVTTFNLVFLFMTVLTAYAGFLLARDVTGASIEAWLAGLLFAWSPMLATRGMGHHSLVAAAPLAIFLLLLRRAAARHEWRDALLLGATVWWAASTDVYYAVYCVLLAFAFAVARIVVFERCNRVAAVRWSLDLLALSVAGLMIAILVSGGWQFSFLGRAVRMRSLYTPTLVLTGVVLIRIAWGYRTSLGEISREDAHRFFRMAAAGAIVATVLLSPLLYSMGMLIAEGQFNRPRVFWRSSPPGADLLAFLVPNPNHPLAPAAVAEWLASRPNGYLENVVSIPLVALGVLFYARFKGWRPSRCAFALVLTFLLLALGPFVTIGGVNTHVPGPWALLRYAPIIGLARAPTRFGVVAILMVSVLFASALTWLGTRTPRYRRALVGGLGALLLFELWEAPRVLHSAAIPDIYREIAADPANVTVLELPFGVRDGTSNVGAFSARTQFYQTMHGKAILGGYLSRVARRVVLEAQGDPVLGALITLSQNEPLTLERQRVLLDQGAEFVRRRRIGYVVFDRERMSDDFRRLAVQSLRLRAVGSDGSQELFKPR